MKQRGIAGLGSSLLVATTVGCALLFLALPIVALVWRAPWASVATELASEEVAAALELSLLTSVSAALLSAVMGLPLAAWLARGESMSRKVARILVAIPMVLPPVVGGFALLMAFGRGGLVGGPVARWLDWALPFTTAGVVVAATYVALPFFVLSAEAGFRSFDRRFDEVAATLGASPLRRFFSVTLPMTAPSLFAGALVAWARALGEFGATITFAGNLRGVTRTMPLAVFVALETRPEAAIVLSLVLVVIAALILFCLRDRWLRPR